MVDFHTHNLQPINSQSIHSKNTTCSASCWRHLPSDHCMMGNALRCTIQIQFRSHVCIGMNWKAANTFNQFIVGCAFDGRASECIAPSQRREDSLIRSWANGHSHTPRLTVIHFHSSHYLLIARNELVCTDARRWYITICAMLQMMHAVCMATATCLAVMRL